MEQLTQLAAQHETQQAELFEDIELLSEEDLGKIGGGQGIIFL